jgi:hypothetical protein
LQCFCPRPPSRNWPSPPPRRSRPRRAPTRCTTANATAAVNTLVTLTLTPPGGMYVYICEIDLTISADATGTSAVQTNVSFTTTNLGGWKYTTSSPADTANQLVLDKQFLFPSLIRSVVPGTAVTIVSPAVRLHALYNINASYYFAY